MTRFIVGSLALVGIIAGAILIEGGNPVAYLMLTPGLLAFLVPLCAVFAVWPAREWIAAWKDAFTGDESPTAARSSAIWEFEEKAAYAAGIVGLVIGVIVLLSSLRELSRLGEGLAVCLLCPFYAALIGLGCRVLKAKVDRKRPTSRRES